MDIRPNTAGSSGAEAAFGSQNAPFNTEHALGERTISALTASPLTSHEARVAETSNVVSQLLIHESGHALATQNGNGNGSLESEFFAAREFTMAPPSNDDALAAFFGNSTPNLTQNQDALAAFFGAGANALTELTGGIESNSLSEILIAEPVSTDEFLVEDKALVLNFSAEQTILPPAIQAILTSGIFGIESLPTITENPEYFEMKTTYNGIVVSQEVTSLTAEALHIAAKSGNAAFSFKPTGQFLVSDTVYQNHGAHFLAHANEQREKKGLPPLEPEKAYSIVSDEIMNKFLKAWAKDLEKQTELQKEDAKETNKKKPEFQRTKEGGIPKNPMAFTKADTDTTLPRLDPGVEIDQKGQSLRADEQNIQNARDTNAKELKKAKADQEKSDLILHREIERDNRNNEIRNTEKNHGRGKP